MTRDSVIDPFLIRKYNLSAPRYTSYPTVPFWDKEIDAERWKALFTEQFPIHNVANGISIYIHLPFCESLCTYCGCNKKITTNHNVEETYLQAIEKEWKQYRGMMQQTPVIRELHLGGGTPTFFSPGNLKRLINSILRNSIVHPMHEFSIEGHPGNTTVEHLKVLASLGFQRISYGVQDLDPEVQQLINRNQPFEQVQYATEAARHAGFTSVNFDLIYGLPLQTNKSLEKTFRQVLELRPERIAFYSYAHLPSLNRAQRLFDESQLSSAEKKIKLYLTGKELLLAQGYIDIGMDHFALPQDTLSIAKEKGTLNRNFMGYTVQNSEILLGLGVSAISDTSNAFAQNEKNLFNYYKAINGNRLAVKRGYFLSDEDITFRQYIKAISCKGHTSFHPEDLPILEMHCFPKLQSLVTDGLIVFDETQLSLTDKGHYFIRNICSAFDLYLDRDGSFMNKSTFSKTI